MVVVGGVVGFVIARNSAAAKEPAGTTAANAYGAGTPNVARPLAAVDSIPQGGATIIQNPPVVIVRGGPQQVHAFSAICTHEGCAVTSVSGGTINCPCHGSRFDVQTGAVVAGPAPRPLPKIAVQVRGGEVFRS
jgi:Rieske Fe-S protein